MKTLTKMFLLSCWCLLLSVSFAKETLDEIKANEEQQLIQEKLEALESQEATQVKEEKETPSFTVLKQERAMKEIPVPNYSNDHIDKEALIEAKIQLMNAETLETISTENTNTSQRQSKTSS